MRIAHRATSLADAYNARDILKSCGIASHIADERLWGSPVLSGTEAIRVMVDNRAHDRARRAIALWRSRAHDGQPVKD